MIEFSYEIIKVDPSTKTMEVIYSSPNRATVHVSARMPYVGEKLEDVIRLFSPQAFWHEQEQEVESVDVGKRGSISGYYDDNSLSATKQRKLEELARARYFTEVFGINVNGVLVKTDRESQATLTGAYVSLRDGLVSSVNWKTSSGNWVNVTLSEILPIATAVTQHVQNCFNIEKALSDQVLAASTIEEVNSITWPS